VKNTWQKDIIHASFINIFALGGLKAMAKKLSGWFRVFIVFAGVWTIPAAFFLYISLPYTEHIEKKRLNKIDVLISEHFDGKKPERNYTDIIEDMLREGALPDPNEKYNKFTTREEELMLERNWHDLADLRIARSKTRDKEIDFSEIERRYKNKIHEYQEHRRHEIFEFLLYWLVPIGLIYGLGDWIIGGFRKDKE
jgi:hypothetical protein